MREGDDTVRRSTKYLLAEDWRLVGSNSEPAGIGRDYKSQTTSKIRTRPQKNPELSEPFHFSDRNFDPSTPSSLFFTQPLPRDRSSKISRDRTLLW